MSIADKLVTIAENQSKVYDAGKLAVLRDSKHMNAKASGAVVAVNDVSPIEHDMMVKVKSKNLLPCPYVSTYSSYQGIEYTVNDDGSITMDGTATGTSTFVIFGAGTGANATPLGSAFITGDKYMFSTKEILLEGVQFCNITYDSEGKAVSNRSIDSGTNSKTITVSEDGLRLYSYIRVATGTVLENFTIYPMIEHGETATEYVPYNVDLSQVNVKRYGKNLFESNADTLEMVSPEPRRYGYLILLPAGTYTVHAESLVEEFNTWVYHEARDMSGTQIGNIGENYNHPVVGSKLRTVTFTVDEDFYYVIYAAGVTTANNAEAIFKRFNIQLEVGDTATPYEPYIETTTYQANADGTVDGVRSVSPSMRLTNDTDGVTMDCSYLRDIDTYIDNLTMSVAMTGGD